MKDLTCSDSPRRVDVGEVPGELSRLLSDQAAALMVLPMLVDIDRAASPSAPVGALLAGRLTACGVPDLVAFVGERWPDLTTAREFVVVEVLELVSDWADHLMGEAMTAARIRGGASDVLAA
ncbi:MAG: hypothetical protein AAGA59_08220 [Actinomycetota bacterium]